MKTWTNILVWPHKSTGGSLGLRKLLPLVVPTVRQVLTIRTLNDYRTFASGKPRSRIWSTCIVALGVHAQRPDDLLRRVYQLRSECDFEGGFLALVRTGDDVQHLLKSRFADSSSHGSPFGRIRGHGALPLPLTLPAIVSALPTLGWITSAQWEEKLAEGVLGKVGTWAARYVGLAEQLDGAEDDWRLQVSRLKDTDYSMRLRHDARFIALLEGLPLVMPVNLEDREQALTRMGVVVDAVMRGGFGDGSADPDH